MSDDLKGHATDAEWLSFLQYHPNDKVKAAHAEILRLRAENEKLRAEHIELIDVGRNFLQEQTKLREQLRGEQEALLRVVDQREKLRAENEKLRAALKPFAELRSIGLIAFGTEAPDDYTFRQSVSCGIVRAAAAALKETGDE